jgi:hypothetical protein
VLRLAMGLRGADFFPFLMVVCLAVSCFIPEKTSLGPLVKNQPEEDGPRDRGFTDRGSAGSSSCGL